MYRLPLYYRSLKVAIENNIEYISSEELGKSASVPGAQVRKDLSYLSEKGRPSIGYDTKKLALYLENYLGLVNDKEAVLVGVGNLGHALVHFPGFKTYGLKIALLFDNDPKKIGTVIDGLVINPIERLAEMALQMNLKMGIIAVPAGAAQGIADEMVKGGIIAIWNFAPYTIQVPEDVYVKSEDLAAGLAIVSHHIRFMSEPEPFDDAERET